jgi:SAM-dependent methyltransferase
LCGLTIYLAVSRHLLSDRGGGVQGKVFDHLLDRVDELGWDGRGSVLDIGCGSGALSVRAARRYPEARVTGVDCWAAKWDFSNAQCEKNARLEGVASRVVFRRGDAAKLDFPVGAFDACISNLVFHEVRAQPDKLALLREALRVVKPGGYFAFQDVFFARQVYGDARLFQRALAPCAREVRLIDLRRLPFIPRLLNNSLITGFGEFGMICGRK